MCFAHPPLVNGLARPPFVASVATLRGAERRVRASRPYTRGQIRLARLLATSAAVIPRWRTYPGPLRLTLAAYGPS